eukprot:TRINITY_DN9073_c0_g1_i4.p1 TRINITY_DN9073_c0_g1~~TRINITY_DN9073_c0_g1_i4.p1  ORF type:complete len:146 (-),score=34.40 TRINITY_DN9073_c0_g1_i4:125-562(-)
MTTIPTYETFLVQADANEGVFHVKLNRPKKSNAMNPAFWRESKQVFEWAAQETAVKVIILSGEGKNFSAGLDLADSPLNFGEESCEGKKRLALYRMILEMQVDCEMNDIEKLVISSSCQESIYYTINTRHETHLHPISSLKITSI